MCCCYHLEKDGYTEYYFEINLKKNNLCGKKD
jgi:hypothetical protein